MKRIISLVALMAFCSVLFGNSIAVSPMKTVPKKVKSFANDLYAEVTAEKKLIQLFLDEGVAAQRLSTEEQEIDEATSIQNPVEKHADGSETIGMLLHGCNGVFTDSDGVVYFWRLSSPRILHITSQKYEATFLVLKNARPELISPSPKEKGANQSPEPTRLRVTPRAGARAAPLHRVAHL